ncbi:fatty-acid--CoA ligase [Mesorhizobium sp. L-8-10]|uniref:long-chain-fatty-acid--CoA ligase n=1 Tax=unclassified Mesorhizobium TaxID=325217 RepID=UPI0019254D45|nr:MULTISPECIES: long-chain-fatty-acid--CoA ligase [unclassified Mesorhizobium]BCH23441.1 fatty-acid--CoA ligase [Mesorhizobium sp. L-8-3]BCH31223.1 fatty-acid--CoA ligase [Mesorhizobium sp. L-8-10]
MQITQFVRQATTLNPQGTATVYGERRRSWTEFAERTARLAAALKKLGLAAGDFVAVLSMNSDRYVELFYAIPHAGGCFAPMNVRWSKAENAYALKDCGAKVLFVGTDFVGQARELARELPLEALIYMGEGGTPEDMLSYEDLIAASEPAEDAGRTGEDLYAVFYTGGTTGDPKGVAFTHQALTQATVAYLAMLPDIEDLSFAYVGGFFHFSAANAALYITLCAGTHVVLPKFEPVAMMQAISEHGVTNAVMVPTMITMMLNHPDFDRYDLSSLRTLVYGGSPMPRELMAEAARKLPGWRFYQIYGMTETGGFATMLRWRDHVFDGPRAHRIAACGQPAPGVEIRIVDPDGHDLPRGELGEIAMRSDYLMREYLGKPEQTAAALRDGWMFSGDAGYMDKDGYLYVADRVKDMIVTGGENVFSIEVERALYSHPSVMQASVVGVPSEEWGEAVHGIVVLKPGQTATDVELIAHCRKHIGGYKCPKGITFRDEPLPVGPAGKVQKNVLRAPFWEGRTKKI